MDDVYENLYSPDYVTSGCVKKKIKEKTRKLRLVIEEFSTHTMYRL